MRIPPADNRSAHAARAALEAQRAARPQDALSAAELANAQRLRQAQVRQEQEELARGSVGRQRRDAAQTFTGPSH